MCENEQERWKRNRENEKRAGVHFKTVMKKKKLKKSNRAPELNNLRRIREAELGLHHGISEMRRIITELSGLQQLWAVAADRLREIRHTTGSD